MKIKLRQESEGFCLEACIPSIMRYANIEKGSVKIWHENRDTGEITFFIEGRDYRVDYERGLLARSRGGAVPDYRKSAFYGVTPFNHEKYAEGEWGNSAFTVYASYDYLGAEEDRPENLAKANYRLRGFVPLDVSQFRGNSIRYLVLGDSISTGCEAWPADKAYFFLFARELERRTGKKAAVENIAIIGEDTRGGLARFDRDVLTRGFDLISIAYGMNDHNEINGVSCGVPLDEYENNIRKMIGLLRGNSRILLVNCCYPNDRWYYHGTKTHDYAEAVRRLGKEYRLPVADAAYLWERELDTGKTHKDLLMNDINHPNNYGHRLYAAAFSAALDPD